MNPENREPTQDELDFLWRQGFEWFGRTSTAYNVTSDWLFRKNGKVYDLSAADLLKIDQIEAKGLFVVRA